MPSLALEAELDEAAAELLDDVLEEAAEAAFERVARGTKKFAFLAAPWRSDSASAARFFSALAAVIEDLCFAPGGLPLPMLLLSYCSPIALTVAEREPDKYSCNESVFRPGGYSFLCASALLTSCRRHATVMA